MGLEWVLNWVLNLSQIQDPRKKRAHFSCEEDIFYLAIYEGEMSRRGGVMISFIKHAC